MQHPKFTEKIKDSILTPAMQQGLKPSYGIVLGYESANNTCSILTVNPGSDQMGEVYQNVPAPMNLGVQTVAPKAGIMCWLAYKDGNTSAPMITHFYNLRYEEFNKRKQSFAATKTPRYLLDM